MRIRYVVMAAVAAFGLAGSAMAEDFRLGDLTVSQPWARASAGKAKAGAAYVAIANHGDAVDRLVKIATPVAKKAEIHTHTMDGGIMKMRRVMAIEVNPGAPTVFKPGGLHIMLMGLTRPLRQGERFPMSLVFEKAGAVEVEVTVRKIGSMGPAHDGQTHGTGHGMPGS